MIFTTCVSQTQVSLYQITLHPRNPENMHAKIQIREANFVKISLSIVGLTEHVRIMEKVVLTKHKIMKMQQHSETKWMEAVHVVNEGVSWV